MSNANQLSGTGQEIRTTLLDPLQMLDDRERIFAEHISTGARQINAARAAGFKQPEKLGYRITGMQLNSYPSELGILCCT